MYTLSDFLSLEQLKNATVLTVKKDFSNVEIKHVSVIEPPVENFIQEQELVFSTAIGCINDDALFLKFVQEIYQCHSSALILCFKPENKAVPASIIDFSNSVNFPVIRIPWESRFSELVGLTLDGIRASANKHMILYEKLQKELLNSFLSEHNLHDACILISNAFQAAVIIYDRFKHETAMYKPDKNSSFSKSKHQFEINVNGYIYGFIELSDFSDSSEIPFSTELVTNYLSIPLSLWFNKEDVITLTSLKIKNDFIWKLTTSNTDSLEQLIASGKKLGISLSSSYVGIALKFVTPEYQIRNDLLTTSNPVDLISIENMILSIANKQNINILVTSNSKLLFMYVELNQLTAIHSFLDLIVSKINTPYKNSDCFFGIGEIPPAPMDFSQQYQKASLALNLCIGSNAPSRRMTYRNSRITNLITQVSKNEQIIDQAKQLFNRFVETDLNQSVGTNLMLTLVTYIKCNYNASLTARELNLHRQSLLYRLEKIEQLTDCSLTDHDDLFLLEFYARLLNKL